MIEIFPRKIQKNIENWLFKGFILVVYGARQVGKTTLVKNIISKFQDQAIYLNADEYDIKTSFEEAENFTDLQTIVGNKKLIVIDEAQRIKDIGLKLKILFDNLKDTQIIATGSSSFDLANSINEPLTGRSLSFTLYPLSIEEVTKNSLEQQRVIDRFLGYGSYPRIFNSNASESKILLKEITEQYLFKDLLSFSGIRKPDALTKLLKLLAFQISQQFSYHEIGTSIGLDQETVAKYIDILEKSFVVLRFPSFGKNLRNEIKKSQKIYFYDLGMRNSLINDFNELEIRPDLGHLWENFCVLERLKYNSYRGSNPSYYFWRNYDKQEIDLIEDWQREKNLQCFEFKYNAKSKYKFPKEFNENYPNSEQHIINKNNFGELLS